MPYDQWSWHGPIGSTNKSHLSVAPPTHPLYEFIFLQAYHHQFLIIPITSSCYETVGSSPFLPASLMKIWLIRQADLCSFCEELVNAVSSAKKVKVFLSQLAYWLWPETCNRRSSKYGALVKKSYLSQWVFMHLKIISLHFFKRIL